MAGDHRQTPTPEAMDRPGADFPTFRTNRRGRAPVNVVDRIRSILDPRPTATARGFRADRVGRSTFHYRPVFPVGRPLDPVHAARLLMTDAVHSLTADQLDQVGRVLGLTATDQATATVRPADQLGADREWLTATVTGQRADQDRERDRVTATGAPSATDRATVSRSTVTDRQGRGAA